MPHMHARSGKLGSFGSIDNWKLLELVAEIDSTAALVP